MALSPAPPAVGMRQGTPARLPLGPVARVVVPPTALLTRGPARGPNWFPIPFISVIDVIGLAAIGAALLLAAVVAVAPLARDTIGAASHRYRLPNAAAAMGITASSVAGASAVAVPPRARS